MIETLLNFMIYNQIAILVLLWCVMAVDGFLVSLRAFNASLGDRDYIRTRQISGPKVILVEDHLDRAFNDAVTQIIFGVVGFASLAARTTATTTNLTSIGLIVYGGFFIVLLRLIQVNLRSYRRRDRVIAALLAEPQSHEEDTLPHIRLAEHAAVESRQRSVAQQTTDVDKVIDDRKEEAS